jgi:glycosyltransferase involved in cell wall biosynthesis
MRVMVVHNRYLIRGGEEESTAAERELLLQNGHEVDLYQEDNARVAGLSRLRLALKTVWSSESYHILRHRLKERRYDLIHVQNFFPLISPAIYYAARAEGVPVVQSLRNYRLLCPNGALFRDGRLCQDCVGRSVPWPGVVHACYRGSRGATATVAAMLAVHRQLRTWQRMVDVYVALTGFARDKLIEGGLPADKIMVKPNFVAGDPAPGTGAGGYALFVGRLSPEKGLGTVLEAWQRLGGALPLKIVGEGPLGASVEEAAAQSQGVEFLGRRSLQEVSDLMGAARFLILPSEWYEPFGRVAIEAFARGTPVFASDLGGVAELIDDGRTGRLFRPGDPGDLAEHVAWALSHPAELARMRDAARKAFETRYTAEHNYQQLMAIYRRAVADEAPAEGRQPGYKARGASPTRSLSA